MGAPRITTSLRIGRCRDRERNMQDKIDSVERKAGRGVP